MKENMTTELTLIAAYCGLDGKPFGSDRRFRYVMEHMSDGTWFMTDVVDGKPGNKQVWLYSGDDCKPHTLWKQWTWPKVEEAPATTTDTIPHRDIIDALLQGKKVQYWDNGTSWVDMHGGIGSLQNVLSNVGLMYRVKPVPIEKWLVISKGSIVDTIVSGSFSNRDTAMQRTKNEEGACKLLCLELDPDTLDVISARTDAP